MKLKRSYLMHYIDASFGGSGSPKWFLLGKDIEEMSVELNPDTETVKNILDETSVNDNGYEPSMSADPYYANPDDAIYEHLSKIAMNRLTGEEFLKCLLKVIQNQPTRLGQKMLWLSHRVTVVLRVELTFLLMLLSMVTEKKEQLRLQAVYQHLQKVQHHRHSQILQKRLVNNFS